MKNLNSNSSPSPMEALWLIVTIVCLLISLQITYVSGPAKAYIFYIFTGVGFLIWILRRYLRKKDE